MRTLVLSLRLLSVALVATGLLFVIFFLFPTVEERGDVVLIGVNPVSFWLLGVGIALFVASLLVPTRPLVGRPKP